MEAFYETFQQVVMVLCLSALGILLFLLFLMKCCAPVWEALRKLWSLPAIERALLIFCICGFAYYGATKQGWHVGYDGGIKAGATANVVTNDTVSIHWQRDTSGGVYVPETATVYIDYRPNTETNAEWGLLAQTTVGAWGWSGTVQGATNYDYNVWAYYIPPEPVHTNGVWTYKTHFDRNSDYAIPLRARIEVNGIAIATPAEKRKDAERVTAKSYIQDGLVTMWDGIERGDDPLVWRDWTGNGFNLTVDDATWGNDCLYNHKGTHERMAFYSTSFAWGTIEICLRRSSVSQCAYLVANRGDASGLLTIKGSSIGSNHDSRYHSAPIVTTTNAFTASLRTDDLFINGEVAPKNSAQEGWRTGSMNYFQLGGRYGNVQNALVGDVYCVRIYSRALIAEEIEHNYKVDKERFNLP